MRLTDESYIGIDSLETNRYIKLSQLEDLMEKYEFETVEDLDNFLMSKIPMVYENGKWRRAKGELLWNIML